MDSFYGDKDIKTFSDYLIVVFQFWYFSNQGFVLHYTCIISQKYCLWSAFLKFHDNLFSYYWFLLDKVKTRLVSVKLSYMRVETKLDISMYYLFLASGKPQIYH